MSPRWPDATHPTAGRDKVHSPIFKEGPLAPIAALRHMMRNAGKNEARKPGHDRIMRTPPHRRQCHAPSDGVTMDQLGLLHLSP